MNRMMYRQYIFVNVSNVISNGTAATSGPCGRKRGLPVEHSRALPGARIWQLNLDRLNRLSQFVER
jgi:hypothetical protein